MNQGAAIIFIFKSDDNGAAYSEAAGSSTRKFSARMRHDRQTAAGTTCLKLPNSLPGQSQARIGTEDPNWPGWYAEYNMWWLSRLGSSCRRRISIPVNMFRIASFRMALYYARFGKGPRAALREMRISI